MRPFYFEPVCWKFHDKQREHKSLKLNSKQIPTEIDKRDFIAGRRYQDEPIYGSTVDSEHQQKHLVP